MSDEHHSGLLYGLEQRIPPLPAFFSALQHVLAGLVGIITPPLIIGATLGLGDWLPYLISMSLLASGIGTFLQSNRVWGIGAGMICMQGTSFAFLGVTVAGGMWVKAQGGGPQDMMAMLFGVNFVAALVPVIVSRFIEPHLELVPYYNEHPLVNEAIRQVEQLQKQQEKKKHRDVAR